MKIQPLASAMVMSSLAVLGLGGCGGSAGDGTPGSGGMGGGQPGSGGLSSAGGANGGMAGGGITGGGGQSTGGGSTGGQGGGSSGGQGGGGTGSQGAGGLLMTGGMGGVSAGGAGGMPTGGTSGGAGMSGGGAGGGNDGWLAGYTATMFGDVNSGDCSGVSNYSDMTNIAGATCTRQGVTIAPYNAGTANNASYYGAPGDLSGIWEGPECRCQNGDAEDGSGLCSRAPSCPMEQVCGQCFEIRCDPNGTGMYSDGATREGQNYCNANQTAVIQIIDACPHNHPSNTWWCSREQNHIDISCSAMEAIAGNPDNVGLWGWLNVEVRPVDCSVGLGPKP